MTITKVITDEEMDIALEDDLFEKDIVQQTKELRYDMIAFFVKWIGVFVLVWVVYTLSISLGGLKIAFTYGSISCSWGMIAGAVALYFGAQVTAKS